MKEFRSFYKTVTGNEGQKCYYPTRLDTYGCGCLHDCKYCYAKSLLSFRNLWNPLNPSVADIKKIENKIKTLPEGSVVRLGGMTDCFQPCEKRFRVTYETIKLLNKYNIHYLIVTKSDLVAEDDYMAVMDKKLSHIQITVTSTDDKLAATYECAPSPTRRIAAIEKLYKEGFDVQLRLSPFIPEFLDFNVINNVKCDKVIVEFLRVNSFIKKTFTNINYDKYIKKEGGYYHLDLKEKISLLKNIYGFKELSVCEDSTEAYNYWKQNVNYNKNDCCNLRFSSAVKPNFEMIGNKELMKRKKVAFLCSRTVSKNTAAACENWARVQSEKQNCVISGFQSDMEKKVLSVILNNNGYAIMVLAHEIFKKCPQKFEQAVRENRLLIVSFCSDGQIRTTRESAEERNKKVLELSDSIVVGCIKRRGMTEELINQTNKPKFILDEKRID